jgi:alcohol dehydrogenase (cytochrome c)
MRFVSSLLVASVVISVVMGAASAQTGADWPHYGGTQLSWRYSTLDQINAANVKSLAPAWIFQTGDYAENLQSTPLVVDGVMYLITPRAHVFALDAATGRQLWQYTYSPSRAALAGSEGTFVQNRGLALSASMVLFGTVDNNLIALDSRTGAEEWRVAVDDPRQCGCNMGAAPLVAKDKVIVGGNNGDGAHRGYLTAFYVKTGRFAWRWYVVPGPGEKGHETWKGDSWKFGGGSPWLTGSYDPELNLVYWGTGNAGSDFNDRARTPGADKTRDVNLYTASVVALDADTGKLRWHNQEVPDDVWDFDASYESILIDREVKGRLRKLLVHMNKSGLTFLLDRVTGELIGVFSTPELQTWISGITEDGKLVGRKEPEPGKPLNYCPSVAGAKSWNSMAWSPRTALLYAPINELCNTVTATSEEGREGASFMNGGFRLNLPPNRSTYSHLDAWDPITGKRIWSYPYKYVLLASVLATAGDLVFTGDPEGFFFALDARTGAKLWSFQTGAGNRGSPIAYSVHGRQYIATPSGWQGSLIGSATAALFPEQEWHMGSTLVVFALPQ